MRTLLTSSFLSLFLLSTACQSPPPMRDSVAPMLSVLEAQQRAWNAGSIEEFMAAGYWESDELTFLSGGDWTRGYDTVLGRYRRKYREEGGQMGQLRFDGIEALRLSRTIGLVRGRWTLTYPDAGDKLSGLFTLVMEQRPEADGSWRIVHDHTSAGAPAE